MADRISRTDLAAMSSAEIELLRKRGLLDHLLAPEPEATEAPLEASESASEPSGVPKVPTGPRGTVGEPEQLGRRDLLSMTPEAINQARREGRLSQLMGPGPDPRNY